MLKKIPLHLIVRNDDQPRQHFDPKSLESLAESIRENGLQQPITVRPIAPDEDGHKFQIIMGERRYRAHLLLAETGDATEILCQVRTMDDRDTHINAIIENLHRDEVSAIEEAYAYHHAITEFGFTPADLAKRLGITQAWLIPNRLALLNLTKDNQDLLARGVISKKQALAMSELSPIGQTRFLELVKKGLVSTNASCESAAAKIASLEAQTGMAFPEPTPTLKVQLRNIESKIDKIGAAVSALYSEDGFAINGTITEQEAHRCIEKLRMIKANMGQIEREIIRAASLSAIAA